jgi:8-oxo-dGTP pyrophosphatase MutT (NUDIX family)
MSAHNPWKTLSTRRIYENPWIQVREDQVLRPDGSPGIYGVVEAKVATGAVALTEKQEVYLVGQYRYPTAHYSWEIIEGGAEPNEAPLSAIKRELREEAGLEAQSWEQLGQEVHLSNCFSAEVAYLYVARDLTAVPRQPDVTEILEVRCVPFAEALHMVDSGEIKDAMSIMALLRVARALKL